MSVCYIKINLINLSDLLLRLAVVAIKFVFMAMKAVIDTHFTFLIMVAIDNTVIMECDD